VGAALLNSRESEMQAERPLDRPLLSVAQAAALIGLSESQAYR